MTISRVQVVTEDAGDGVEKDLQDSVCCWGLRYADEIIEIYICGGQRRCLIIYGWRVYNCVVAKEPDCGKKPNFDLNR